jgi:hypothetical protein
VITVQPQNSNPVNFNGVAYVAVTGSGSNLTYQWYYGESGDTSHPVSSATSSTLSLSLSSTVRFWVRVSGQCGSADSVAVWGSVYPRITQQPDQSITVGYNATASTTVGVSGTYLHYVWKWANGVLVPGASDSPTLITPSVTSNTYAYCEVSSGTSVITSATTSLNLCYDGPTITSLYKGTGWVYITASSVYDYAWYRGARGDTSHPFATGTNAIYPYPTVATQYWCRAYSSSTGTSPTCYTDSDVVTLP